MLVFYGWLLNSVFIVCWLLKVQKKCWNQCRCVFSGLVWIVCLMFGNSLVGSGGVLFLVLCRLRLLICILKCCLLIFQVFIIIWFFLVWFQSVESSMWKELEVKLCNVFCKLFLLLLMLMLVKVFCNWCLFFSSMLIFSCLVFFFVYQVVWIVGSCLVGVIYLLCMMQLIWWDLNRVVRCCEMEIVFMGCFCMVEGVLLRCCLESLVRLGEMWYRVVQIGICGVIFCLVFVQVVVCQLIRLVGLILFVEILL